MSAATTAAVPMRVAAGVWLRRAAPITLLLLVTLGLGLAGQGAARPVFVFGAAVVAWDLLRFGASAHFSASFVLFCVAPFLRRVVDVSAGYDPSGIMIAGPLVALLVVAPRVIARLSDGRRLDPALWPFIVAAACLLYAIVLTMVQGDLAQALSGALKWGAPLTYGFWLHGEAGRDPSLVRAAARVSMILAPALGVYGLLQYVDPPVWDRFWMVNTSIASIGRPEPYQVRVFSMMDAPAGYATFTAAALLLLGFGRSRRALVLAAAPSMLGLMLSMYRAAWTALALGLLLGLCHGRTVRRAAILLGAVALLAAAIVLLTPAGSAGSDASGPERLAGYAELVDADGGTLWGNGFGSTDVMRAGASAQDGQFVVTWFLMGLIVGIIEVSALLWVAFLGLRGAWRNDTLEGVAVAGIIAGMVVQLPLAVVSASEIGFLFWSFAAIGAALPSSLRNGHSRLR